MDLLLNIAGYFLVLCIGYYIGYVKVLYVLVSQSIDATVETSIAEHKVDIEKHNAVYYAYVNNTFVAQSNNFIELCNCVKSAKLIGNFVISKETVDTLSVLEQGELLLALHSTFNNNVIS